MAPPDGHPPLFNDTYTTRLHHRHTIIAHRVTKPYPHVTFTLIWSEDAHQLLVEMLQPNYRIVFRLYCSLFVNTGRSEDAHQLLVENFHNRIL
ncbi:hypothetical protein M8C21_030409, partial [Ambrosia artemisiifolia]